MITFSLDPAASAATWESPDDGVVEVSIRRDRGTVTVREVIQPGECRADAIARAFADLAERLR